MSEVVRNWVEDHSPARGVTRLVLLGLARNADAHGENSWPSVATLMRRANCSETSVHRALARLQSADPPAIEKTGVTPSGTFVYRVVMADPDGTPGVHHAAPKLSLRGPKASTSGSTSEVDGRASVEPNQGGGGG